MVAIGCKEGANGHDSNQTRPFGHKLVSISIQQSSNGVRCTRDLILKVNGYMFNYL
jgi:hypothetical protein